LEALPVDRSKAVDMTATANLGLLAEMSFAELRMRLEMLKQLDEEELEMRRRALFDGKVSLDGPGPRALPAMKSWPWPAAGPG
jgi:hypothetical protein